MEITSYRHAAPDSFPPEADTAPGPYYVSALDAGRYVLASGPYASHRAALDRVALVRAIAERHDSRAVFYAFGTVRMAPDVSRPGVVQGWGYDALTLAKNGD